MELNEFKLQMKSIELACDISCVIDLIWRTAKKGTTLLAMNRERRNIGRDGEGGSKMDRSQKKNPTKTHYQIFT